MVRIPTCPNCNGTVSVIDDDDRETRRIDEDNYAVTYLARCNNCKNYFHFDKIYKYTGIILRNRVYRE